MEIEIKCSNKNHREINAISYRIWCNVYLCKKCLNYHSELLESHNISDLDKNVQENFTGLCKEHGHRVELSFYCKAHNQLCCAACLSKIKEKGNGQHHECEVCSIDEIKETKRNNLNKNIKLLEEFSSKIDDSINELKNIFKNISKKKEELKINIAKIFTKIRTTINEREDENLAEVEKIYEESFFKEDIIKISEKLPNQIKISLKNGKDLNEKWDDDKKKLNSKINDCINIENNIKTINELIQTIEKCNSQKMTIKFLPKGNDINPFLEVLTKFGEITYSENNVNDFKFKFRLGQNYSINENGKIATKNGSGNSWNCTIFGGREIPKNSLSKWKIKLNSDSKQFWEFIIGIGPKIKLIFMINVRAL